MKNSTNKFGLMATAGLLSLSAASIADAQQLPAYEDDSEISLTGTVASVAEEEFSLDYGDGVITVELDNWLWDEAENLIPGQKVTVRGEVDDDLFEGREIVAETVFVHDRSSYYFNNPQMINNENQQSMNNQQDMNQSMNNNAWVYSVYAFETGLPEGSWVSTTGTIQNIMNDNEFTVSTNNGSIQIDTANMQDNPLDDQGALKLDEGDRIYVSGKFDSTFFDTREIQANTIVTLNEASASDQRVQNRNINQNNQTM